MHLNDFYDKANTWILAYGPRVIIACIIMIAGQLLIRSIRNWMEKGFRKKRLDSSIRPFFIGLMATLMQILLILTVLQVIGVQMTVFAALIGGVGIAFGLALSGTLQNFTSGVLILILKPFGVGDTIIAQGEEGTVTVIRTFYTVVTTFDNKTVIIPNSKLSNEVIVNLSRQGKRRIDIEMKFSYAFVFEEIRKIIRNSIDNSKDLLDEPESRIGILNLEPDGYVLVVHVWVPAHGYIDARLNLQARILEDLKTAGIKLPGMV